MRNTLNMKPLITATALILSAAILYNCGETREQQWGRQSPGERLSQGLKNPSNNPPGRGFNTSD